MASTGSFRERVWEPLKEIARSPVSRLIVLLVFYVLSAYSLMASFTPSLLTNYFANQQSDAPVDDHVIDCTGDDRKKLADICRHATNTVMAWKSVSAVITHFALGVFLYPTMGKWSDLWGRKPFVLLAFMGAILQPVSILLYLRHGLPLWWYYVVGVLASCGNPFLTAMAYVADVISPSARTIAFASVGIVFSVGFTIGPILTASGAIPDVQTAAWASLGCALVCVTGTAVILPESLSSETRMAARATLEAVRDGKARGCFPWANRSFRMFWDSLSILFRSKFFAKLTIGIVAVYVNFEEVHEMQAIYFQEVAGFDKDDTAQLFAVSGVASWFTVTLVLWLLLSVCRMSDKQVLLFGMSVFAVQQVTLAFVRTKAVILVVKAAGTAANLVLPAISSLKSNNVAPEEQGALQGAIQSAQSVAKSFGPGLFYLFFVVFRSNGWYLPGAPFLFGFALLVGAIVVIITMEVPVSSWGTTKGRPGGGTRNEDCADPHSAPLLVSHHIALSDSEDNVAL